MHVIDMALGNLDPIDKLIPALENLGARHTGYGAREEHYETVGVCLLWTLEQGLGEAFTDEVREV
jgi:hemoglobin-like flavoprotein